MTAIFVFLLSCLAYGIIAAPPASSPVAPVGGAVAGRLGSQGPAKFPGVSQPAVSRPSTSNLQPGAGVGGRRPAGPVSAVSGPSSSYLAPGKAAGASRQTVASGPASAASVSRPAVVGASGRPIPSAVVGAARPISSGNKAGAGARPSLSAAGAPVASSYGSRPGSSKVPY